MREYKYIHKSILNVEPFQTTNKILSRAVDLAWKASMLAEMLKATVLGVNRHA